MKGDVIARWSARKLLYAAAGVLIVVFVLVVVALLDNATDTPKLFGLVAAILIVGLVIALIVVASRSEVVLMKAVILTRGHGGRENSLALEQMCGIAVIRVAPGWAIFIWAASGDPIRLAAPERVFRLKAQSGATADADYWNKVMNSPAGIAAAQIYRQACTVQGPAGKLSRSVVATFIERDRQLFRGADCRWWSPSGKYGTAP